MSPEILLAALILFQIKHLLADFVLQTGWMLRDKAVYAGAGGVAHAGVHVLLTAPILVWVGGGAGFVLGVVLAEFVLHYHIDWAKARLSLRAAFKVHERRYWIAYGLDQALHQLTYVGILYASLLWASG